MKMFTGSLGDWYLLLRLPPFARQPRVTFERAQDGSLADPAEHRVLVHILANDASRGTQKIRDVTLLGSDAQMECELRPVGLYTQRPLEAPGTQAYVFPHPLELR